MHPPSRKAVRPYSGGHSSLPNENEGDVRFVLPGCLPMLLASALFFWCSSPWLSSSTAMASLFIGAISTAIVPGAALSSSRGGFVEKALRDA